MVDADGDEAFRVHDDTPIEQLMASEGLRSLGALMVIDSDDRLRGVVTLEQVRRALTAAAPGARRRAREPGPRRRATVPRRAHGRERLTEGECKASRPHQRQRLLGHACSRVPR